MKNKLKNWMSERKFYENSLELGIEVTAWRCKRNKPCRPSYNGHKFIYNGYIYSNRI